MRVSVALAVSAWAIAVLVPAASARRDPSKGEAKAIDRAAQSSSAKSVGCFRTRKIVVSTAGPWARATLVPCAHQTDNAVAVFERRQGRWSMRRYGTSRVGCIVPGAVRRDLKLSCA
jgi:hypothetical protein